MSIGLACGFDEDLAWVFLTARDKAARGRGLWSILVDQYEIVIPHQIHAWSPQLELIHPGIVPMAASAPFGAFLADLEDWLGDAAFFERFVIGLPDGVVLAAEREESVRLEAGSLELVATRLPRLSPPSAGNWVQILERLRDEAMTNKYLTIDCDGSRVAVSVHGGAKEYERGEVKETLAFQLDQDSRSNVART